jgi:hypothetical protein
LILWVYITHKGKDWGMVDHSAFRFAKLRSSRHLEVCEERLRQHFEAETRQLLEMAERQILGEAPVFSWKIYWKHMENG